MKKSLRHIIRQIIKEVEDDDPFDTYQEPFVEPGTNTYGGFGGGGGGMQGDFGIPFDLFLGDQLFFNLYGGSNADEVMQNVVDAMNAPGDFEDNIGGAAFDSDYEDASQAISQYIAQYITDLQNYYNNQMPSGTEYPDNYNFSDNFAGNYNVPANIEYYLEALNDTSAPQLQAAIQDTLETYCHASTWYIEAIAGTTSLAGAAIQAHMEQHANAEGGALSVPFDWCPEQYATCFPTCNETPWVQHSMSKEEYCEWRFGGPTPQFPETSCFNNLFYNCLGAATPTPIQPTLTSGHGCMDPAAFNYNPDATSSCACAGSADVGTFNAQAACPCNYDATLQLQTMDGDTLDDLPSPEPTDKDPIKKDTSIGVTPPRPERELTKQPKFIEPQVTGSLNPILPKITPVDNVVKSRLQKLANIQKQK
tara:strand:- start:45 stop:1307 length:1263 start_codon:yes stop_codon:yes gene_type:complete